MRRQVLEAVYTEERGKTVTWRVGTRVRCTLTGEVGTIEALQSHGVQYATGGKSNKSVTSHPMLIEAVRVEETK